MPINKNTRNNLPALKNRLAAGVATFLLTTATAAAQTATPTGTTATTSQTNASTSYASATVTTAAQPDPAVATDPGTPPLYVRSNSAAPATTDAANTDDGSILGRLNLRMSPDNTRTGTIGDLRPRLSDIDAPGIRVGTFIIRPSIGQGIGVEKQTSGGSTTTRSYLQTTGKLQIVSDWAIHQLTINATGIWQNNIGGSGSTQPSATIDGKLRLDVDRLTIANLTALYSFQRESSTDPNSIAGASVQSGIHTMQGGADITREFGRIRGTVGGTLTRNVYTAATLSDGTLNSMSDRNQTDAEMKLRVGYELSPAVIPFVELSGGRIFRDRTLDRNGYNRNANVYAAKTGVEFDFGDKLRGEVSVGYKKMRYFDSRLSNIDAFTTDGTVYWSPIRGTDVTLGLTTGIDPSTTAGVSGATYYTLSTGLSQQMIDNLVARLSGSTTFRHFAPTGIASDQTEYMAGAGLTWSLSRYIELAGDVSWNYTDVKTGTDTTTWKALAEIRVKR